MSAIFLVLISNLCFSFGSQFFAHYTKRFSSLWMNTFKAIIACLCFGLYLIIIKDFAFIESKTFLALFVSGFIGLGVGDIFLLEAFSRLGPSKTLMLFSFNPVIVGILSFFLFGQIVPLYKLYAIFFFMICLFLFSLEGRKKQGSWEIKGLLFALFGISLDALGIILTKQAFEWEPSVHSIKANFLRCIGALIAYSFIRFYTPIDLIPRLKKLTPKAIFWIVLACFLGTFLSLSLYLYAIQQTKVLASITALSITGVLFSSSFEYIWKKELPSRYFWLSLTSFSIGMFFVLDLFKFF